MKNKLSIIFLHWVEENGPEKETLLSLESIFRYTYVPFELIVVSNGSTQSMNDKIHNLVKNTFLGHCEKVKFINNETNLGVSKGFNTGLKVIEDDSKYISIFSNDWLCSPNWANLVIDELEKDKNCGFITCCTNIGAGSFSDMKENPVSFERPVLDVDDEKIFDKIEVIARHTYQALGHTTYNNFPAMGWTMKRQVFNDVGLMDERIKCANDVAYAVKAFNLGYTSKTAWAPYIHHFWHASFSQVNDKDSYSYLRPIEQKDFKLIKEDVMYKGDNKRIAIAISTYFDYSTPKERLEIFKESIISLLNSGFNEKIFLVDDGSMDKTHLDWVKEYDKNNKITIYEKKINGGIAKCKNTSIRLILHHGYNYGFIVDDDILYEKDFFKPYLETILKTKLGFFSISTNGLSYPIYFNNESLLQVNGKSGCFFTISREIVEKVGYFKVLPYKYGYEHELYHGKIMHLFNYPCCLGIPLEKTKVKLNPKSNKIKSFDINKGLVPKNLKNITKEDYSKYEKCVE